MPADYSKAGEAGTFGFKLAAIRIYGFTDLSCSCAGSWERDKTSGGGNNVYVRLLLRGTMHRAPTILQKF